MSSVAKSVSKWAKDPRVLELLWFCLPAFIAGLALRAWLTAGMPYAFFLSDSPDLLVTADRLINKLHFALSGKKTFLVPILYAATFLIPKVPALISIAIFQHVLGLLMIVMCGAITRLWFRFWKWVIVPVTMAVAVHPSLLWFEHTLMAESVYVFCTMLVALVGTIYALRPDNKTFIALCVSLFLEAGARPEGKLFFGFGLLLVGLLHWGDWRTLRWRAGVLVPLGIVTHFLTITSQAGLLLFISVLRFAPPELHSAPGLMLKLAPLQEELQERWETRSDLPRVSHRKRMSVILKQYQEECAQDPTRMKLAEIGMEKLCQKAAKEIVLRRFWLMPRHTLAKFESTADFLPSGTWEAEQLHGRQVDDAYAGIVDRMGRISRGLFGFEMHSIDEISAWVDAHYSAEKVAWHGKLQDWWRHMACSRPDDVKNGDLAGIPYFYWVVAAGMVATLLTTLPQWKLQVSWAAMVMGLAFAIILTANVKERFRFVFEPIYYLYLAGIPHLLVCGAATIFQRKPKAESS